MPTNQNQTNEDVIDLGEIIQVLLSKIFIILLSGIILGSGAILATKMLIKPQYISETKIYVQNRSDKETLTSSDFQTSTFLTQDYTQLIKSRDVLNIVITELSLDLSVEALASKIGISNPADSRVIAISVTDTDPEVAKEIAVSVRENARIHIKNVMAVDAVNVVEEANIPTNPCSPNTKKNGMMGGLLGCVIAAGIVIVGYLMNDTIQTPEDVEHYLQLGTLGSIPVFEEENPRKTKINKKKKRR